MYHLYIANKNYSSWSLRPWVLLRQLQIPFQEHLVPFHDVAAWKAYHKVAPNLKVPCLTDGEITVWDSLAIVEYVAERHAGIWPSDARARGWTRSAAAEMHSGFTVLRTHCSMSCGQRVQLKEITPALQKDINRLCALWADGLKRFGGPFLGGNAFSAVDAFFAPVAFRAQTYDLLLDTVAADYAKLLLSLPAMQDWYVAGLSEAFRDEPHEVEILQFGRVIADLRTPAEKSR